MDTNKDLNPSVQFSAVLSTDSVGEFATVQVKSEIMIEDVVGNFKATSPFNDHTHNSGEDFEAVDEDFQSVLNKEEFVDEEITDDFETKFPFVQCEYKLEYGKESLFPLKVEHDTSLRTYGRTNGFNHQIIKPLKQSESQDTLKDSSTRGLFDCAECNETFFSEAGLNLHQTTFHVTPRCGICNVTFTHPLYLENHLKFCPKKIYNCPNCFRFFHTKQELSFHLRQEHQIGQIKCPLCPERFSQIRCLKKHQRSSHPEINRYKCDACSSSYITERHFIKHRETKHPGIPYDMSLFDKPEDQSISHKTTETHAEELLPKCTVVLSDNQTEKGSEKSNNFVKPPAPPDLLSTDESADSFLKTTVKGNFSKIYRKCVDRIRTLTTIKCQRCDEVFVKIEDLVDHLKQMHVDENPLPNRKDGESFYYSIDASNLQLESLALPDLARPPTFKIQSHPIQHQKTHAAEKPYYSSDCGKGFSLKSTLRNHIQIREKGKRYNKPFLCDTCGESFLSEKDLLIHTNTHKTTQKNDITKRKSNIKLVGDAKSTNSSVQCQEDPLDPEKTKYQDIPPSITETIEIDSDSDESRPEEKKNDSTPSFAFIDCGKSYPKLEEFMDNESKFNSEGTNSAQSVTNLGTDTLAQEKLKFSCDDCGRKFLKDAYLKKHKKINACFRPVPCQHCPQYFHSKTTLEAHVALNHVASKTKVPVTFPCRICNKTFNRKRKLTHHEVTHLKRFKCDKCGQAVGQPDFSQPHRCTVMKPFVCSENIMIHGVPKTKREDEKEILQRVGRAIGVELDFSTVMTVHRIPLKNTEPHPAIVARFKNQELRNLWLRKYQEKKILLASDINKDFPYTKITVEEHVTLLPVTL